MFEYKYTHTPLHEKLAGRVFYGRTNTQSTTRSVNVAKIEGVRLMKLTSSVLKKGIYPEQCGKLARMAESCRWPRVEEYPFICGYSDRRPGVFGDR